MNEKQTTMNSKAEFEETGAPAQSMDQVFPAAAEPRILGCGAQLEAQRESLGWSVEQVANQLNLAPRQILALESDNFSALPGMASIRGFIRSYAKLLKIDAEPLLAQVASATSSPLPEPVTTRRALSAPFFDDSRMSSMGLQGSSNKANLLLPGLILLVVGLFGAYQMGWLPQLPNLLASKPAVETLAASATASVVPPPVDEKKAEPPAPIPVEPAPATEVASTVPAAPAVAPATPVEAAPAAKAANTEPVAAANKAALVLKFREDSWVELRRGDGTAPSGVVVAHVAKAGTSESFDVAEAMTLTIGNVTGVDASLRGSALDIKSSAKNNIVRLNLK